jgi:hypothetical protein
VKGKDRGPGIDIPSRRSLQLERGWENTGREVKR